MQRVLWERCKGGMTTTKLKYQPLNIYSQRCLVVIYNLSFTMSFGLILFFSFLLNRYTSIRVLQQNIGFMNSIYYAHLTSSSFSMHVGFQANILLETVPDCAFFQSWLSSFAMGLVRCNGNVNVN